MKYRKDKRTVKKFASDILECSKIENSLMAAYVADIMVRKGAKYEFRPSNEQANGELIENDKRVTTEADFILKCPDGSEKLIEIKFCRKPNKIFRLKESQLHSYIRQDCCVVVFMGTDTATPKYTIIRPSDMTTILNNCKTEIFWSKKVKRIPCGDLEWFSIDSI